MECARFDVVLMAKAVEIAHNRVGKGTGGVSFPTQHMGIRNGSQKRKEENPNQPVERITIVCMGHEADLAAALQEELADYKIDVQVVDILRDKQDLQLKRDSEAEIVREGDKLVIRAFYPMNLMQKLSLQKEYVEDWRQLVDSIMIDWNYDSVVMQPSVTDVPGKNEMVKGVYDIPENAGTIKVKITDLLSESLEVEVR